MIYRTRGEHANHYATDAIFKIWKLNYLEWLNIVSDR
jgi:hypothetical protein